MTDPGYSIHPQVFGSDEMRALSDALAHGQITRTRAGARHVLGVSAVRTIATDPRMLRLAQSYVGAEAVPFRATLFDKSRGSNWLVTWHQDLSLPLTQRNDDPAWGPWSTKLGVLYAAAPASALERIVALRVHLDDSTADNGPLRVLPGTHTLGVLNDDEVQRLAATITPVECLVMTGGIVAMRPLAVHASSKANDDCRRRALHIEYAGSVQIAPAIRLAIT
jgi:hypothetical protein